MLEAAEPQPRADLQHFGRDVTRWQKMHGRSSLPWQNTRDPYRVWLSEIMLQQTQVATVLGYYARFLQRFPDVTQLAAAEPDEVLALWSGLGYYTRARNLHQCAQRVVSQFGGVFPQTAAQLQTLPGIGRSTAAAIASFCFLERVAILDANVKRVLTRVLGFSDDLAKAAAERALWSQASALLPERADMPAYTQGLMDLGATVCLPRQPKCPACPVQMQCAARRSGEPEKYPVRTRTLKRSSVALWMLWARRSDGAVWLERRSAEGIWGGLYCLPVFDSEDELANAVPAAVQCTLQARPSFLHVLTHRDLHLTPVLADLGEQAQLVSIRNPQGQGAWIAPSDWASLGLPAPVRKLLMADVPGSRSGLGAY